MNRLREYLVHIKDSSPKPIIVEFYYSKNKRKNSKTFKRAERVTYKRSRIRRLSVFSRSLLEGGRQRIKEAIQNSERKNIETGILYPTKM